MHSGSPAHLHPLDLALIVLYLLGITLFGLRFREKKGAAVGPGSLRTYFLANNTIPWWAIALSIVSAETSTLTIISVPGVAFTGDFGFLQIVLGYMLGRVVVAMLFLPRYFEGRMLTAYQLIDQRFGSTLHKVTAGLFLLTRAAAEGVRVFAVSIVVGIAIGTGDILSIALITLLTLLYTFEGGMAAVIWTDVVQMVLYVGGTAVALLTLGRHVPGGWGTIHTIAGAAGKFHLFHFALNLTQTYTFWAGVIGGTFLTMASHGTDQLMVQRMLAARNLREARLALLSSGVVIFVQFTFFLLIGAGLYVFYSLRPVPFAGGPAGVMPPDRIFPNFIVHEMPTGIAGLLVAAILAAAMSNLSAALNSLSSTTVVDFYVPWRRATGRRGAGPLSSGSEHDELAGRERTLAAKLSTAGWALVLFGVAVYSVKVGGKGHVVETGLSIASVAYGALLGVFLLGTLTRYATQTGAILGMIAGFGFNLALWLLPSAPDHGWTVTTPAATRYITFPHVAFTWYVFLGSLVTFAVGSAASLLFRKQSVTRRKANIANAAILAFAFLSVIAAGNQLFGQSPPPPASATVTPSANVHVEARLSQPLTPYDFAPVSTLLAEAIAQKKLPGAVVLIGHNGSVVFHQAFGNRKLAGEAGIHGELGAEPMTEDTIFDMASLTKCLVTAVAVMQLYEAGKLQFDDPVAKYLPEFAANGKEHVTIRELLTHYSGLPEDISLKDPWGLAAPDKAEGIRRAMQTTPYGAPGLAFKYSDINFITLGALVEKLTGEALDDYAETKVFLPLHMKETSFPISSCTCSHPKPPAYGHTDSFYDLYVENHGSIICAGNICTFPPPEFLDRTAPTAHDDELTPEVNPNYDHLLRGTVHDPTTRRMGGVAGHAGVFSTAHDIGLFAQALLDKLTTNTGPFPFKQSTLRMMTTPEQPATAQGGATIFTPTGETAKGIAIRGFGWDINSAFSRPRGSIFPTYIFGDRLADQLPSFGHTGFTGTSLWMDPASGTYVILLANAIHPRGGAPISVLRGQVATAAAKALGLWNTRNAENQCTCTACTGCPNLSVSPAAPMDIIASPSSAAAMGMSGARLPSCAQCPTLTGIDVLEQTRFALLKEAVARHDNRLRLGVLTNAAGLDAQGRRTIDILAGDATKEIPQLRLTTLFAAEHGLSAKQDTTALAAEADAATHLPITSLYGPKPGDRRPTHAQLQDLDAIVIDLQDVGNRFWTFDTAMAYFLEASAMERNQSQHDLEVIVLDRPNPTSGTDFAVQGPISDIGRQSYIDYTPLPARHGMTIGELALFFNAEATPAPATSGRGIGAHLTVVPLRTWTRGQFLDQTGLGWVPPSPNLRTLTAATFYPGIGLFETTNLSVGRGTATPFEQFGAPYLKPEDVLGCLAPRRIPGVRFTAATLTIAETADHYPYHGQTIPGIHLTLTDRAVLDPPEVAIEIMTCLHRLYPKEFDLDRSMRILANAETLARLQRGEDADAIVASWEAPLAAFRKKRSPYLLYPDIGPLSAPRNSPAANTFPSQ